MTEPHTFLSAIINAVADPIFVKDEDHRWILLNDAMCDFMGHPREYLIGKSDFDIFPEEEASVFWAKDDEVFQTGQTVENEERFTGADGNTCIISTKKSLFVDEQGGKVLVGVIRDLTQLKRTEQETRLARDEAQRASEAKARFLANVSHELRTPLNGIVGIVELLQDQPWSKELQEMLDVLRESADNLLNLVNELLDFSAIDAGRILLKFDTFEPRQLVHSTAILFETQTRRKSLDFSVDVAENVPSFVLGDVNRTRQILVNLISNSVKFTPENGKVTVRLSVPRDNLVRFEVVDDGLGIPADKLASVFLPFTKARDTDPGTGLGLPISHRLADLMKGQLSLHCKGVGCCARLDLPLQLAPSSEQVPVRSEEKPASFPGLRVLIVEDDLVSSKVAQMTLKRLECEVTLAEDGLIALEAMKSETFHLILMDCRMPNMDGYETSRAIREKEKGTGQRIPIFALTAHAFEEEMEKCLKAGMDQWLTKPLRRVALVSAMSKYF